MSQAIEESREQARKILLIKKANLVKDLIKKIFRFFQYLVFYLLDYYENKFVIQIETSFVVRVQFAVLVRL